MTPIKMTKTSALYQMGKRYEEIDRNEGDVWLGFLAWEDDEVYLCKIELGRGNNIGCRDWFKKDAIKAVKVFHSIHDRFICKLQGGVINEVK